MERGREGGEGDGRGEREGGREGGGRRRKRGERESTAFLFMEKVHREREGGWER